MSENVDQAQILSPVFDPSFCGFSKARVKAMVKEAVVFSLTGSAALATYPNPWLCVPCALACAGSVLKYMIFERDEKTLAFHQAKKDFKKREKQGYESIWKYSEKTTEKQVLDHIPWKHINEETGLSTFNHPNSKEYHGRHGFTAIAIAPPEVDRTVMNENFRRAFRALARVKGSWQKVIMMTGIDPKFILNDIDELLKQPKLTPVRKAELLSMKKKFSQKTGIVDRTYLIYIGLPYTTFDEVAQKNMNRIVNGYFKILSKRKVKTVVIKEHGDMIDIYQGMLTGKKLYGVV